MSELVQSCPNCGANLPADAPAGICPKCLLAKGLDVTVDYESSPADLLEPDQQFGPYRLGRLLGKGGMGAVYDAEHVESGRRVALKVLNHRLESPEHRRRFLREGRLAAAINHPNNIYVFGTEEIDGTPVIAMELARGGTLQERVEREGPLAIGAAVDSILQIIAGLEAAAEAGVLHRDVKPSNCFVDTEGNVKIGDFGLSISTESRDQTNITQSGVFLGTPAFSSPEQLRGDELDVRSDIYSVGVTLYYLLTGETPFQAKQMVQLLATVLERPAPSPQVLRPEIPSGLAAIVRKCLAKLKTDRFDTYEELRQAVLPYCSRAPTAATLGFRFLAVCLDFVVILIVAHLLTLTWVRDWATWDAHSSAILDPGPRGGAFLMLLTGVGMLLHLCYYALSEGIWGASVGKAACRLRVTRTNREVPGVPRALLRAAIYYAASWLPLWVAYGIDPEAAVAGWDGDDATFSVVLPALSTLGCVALFVSARRQNGYSGLHELASGTRVVRNPVHERRPRLTLAEEPIAEASGQQQFGPYYLLGPVTEAPEGLLLAYDTRLLRKVWIRKCPNDAPPVPSELRILARVGRLRWLCGSRGEGEAWDAYEAPSGKPLLGIIGESQPWDAVRFWLCDLAVELHASHQDGTVPEVVDLDRVWITADGRAKLLDFPAPGLNGGLNGATVEVSSHHATCSTTNDHCTRGETASGGRMSLFLKQVALAALEGRVLTPAQAKAARTSVPLPLSARDLLNGLGHIDDNDSLRRIESLTARPATVTVQRKLGILASCWVLPIIGGLYIATMNASEAHFLKEYPAVGGLCGYVSYYRALDGRDSPAEITDEMRKAVGIYVAQEFRSTINDPHLWTNPMLGQFLDERDQQLLKDFVRDYGEASPQEVAQAQKLVQLSSLQILQGSYDLNHFPFSWPMPAVVLAVAAAFISLLVVPFSLLSVLIFGNSLLLWIFDVAIVNGHGEPASRLRIVWRSAVLWTLVVMGLALIVVLLTQFKFRVSFLLLIYIIGMIVYDMFRSKRGLQDWLSGTWLVPC